MTPAPATIKCRICGVENESSAVRCANPSCGRSDWRPLAGKSEVEVLTSIDGSLKTIKGIAIWFLVLSILGLVLGLMVGAGVFR
jgi:hypothetical protein